MSTVLETKYEEQAKKNASKINREKIAGTVTAPNLMGMATIHGDSKVELQLGSGIFVDRAELENVLDFDDKPRSMVRRLMRLIVGERDLRNMSAGGRSQRPGIPSLIKKVVYKFVRKNAADGVVGLTAREYTRTLNLMCSTIRSQTKSTVPSTAEAGGSQQASPRPS